MADIVRLWDQAIWGGIERSFRRGQIGRINASGQPTITVPDSKGKRIYVRLGVSGSDGVIEAFPVGVPLSAHTYVSVFQLFGRWLAVGDFSSLSETASNGGGAVGPHTHRRHSGLEYIVEPEMFAPGVVLPAGGLTVSIGRFRYPNSGNGETYAGGTIDLTSHVPGTANKWRWVVVGVNPDTNAAVAVSGSDFDTQAELTRAEIDNVAFAGYIPLAAIQVANGDTALTNISRYYDAKPWFVPSRGQTDYTFDLNSEGALTVTNANTGNAATAGIRLESDVSVGQLFATGENYAANGWADAVVAVTNATGGFIWQSNNIRLQNVAGTDAMQVTTGNVIMSGNLTVPTVYGGTGDGDALTLAGSSHANGGPIVLTPPLGVGIASPDGTLHVHTASAGTVDANTIADDVVVERDTNGGISILTPDAAVASLIFGTPSDNLGAILQWDYNNDVFVLAAHKTGAALSLRADVSTEVVNINSSKLVSIAGDEGTASMRIVHGGEVKMDTGSFSAGSANGGFLRLYDDAENATIFLDGRDGAGRNCYFINGGNFGIGTTNQFGSGNRVIGIANRTVAPTTNPSSGGVLYAEGGALKWRGSSGTVSTIAPS